MSYPESVIALTQQAITSQALTASRIVDDCLARIQAWDQDGPCLNAVVAVNQQVQDSARQLDHAFTQTGQLVGPLHGIPVLVKDNFHTMDMPTRGSAAALSDAVTAIESTITRRLRAAGAMMLAKTNMHELALAGVTVSSLAGQTRNPFDLGRTPGGSSGGTGAGLAAGYGLVGLGTDTVNSIRSPASAQSLVGLRPTRGLVSRAGLMPVAETQDVAGPLTYTVTDAARVLNVIAGFDADDPATAQAVGERPACYVAAMTGNTLAGARIGVMRSLFGHGTEHHEVNAAMAQALDAMRDGGAFCVDIDDEAVDSPQIIKQLDVQKWEFKELFNNYLQQRGDASIHTLSDLIASDMAYPGIRPFLTEANRVENRWDDKEYLSRLAGMTRMRDHLLFLMARHNLDALVYPLQKRLVVPIGEHDQAERNGIVAAVTGLPAINLPVGFSSPDASAPRGVPIGMDMLGRPFQEARLLQLAAALERALAVQRWPQGMDPVWSQWLPD